MTHIIDEWQKCYPSNWKGLIVPEAMAHPAKYSSKLIRRIYEHLAEEGWVRPGDGVIDPFGGVALGALDAMRLGLHWNGVELEEKFFYLGNANIQLWLNRFGDFPNWGSARLLNGDSRHLLEILQAEPARAADGYGSTDGQLSSMKDGGFNAAISSPPYNPPMSQEHPGTRGGARGHTPSEPGAFARYGNTSGQLEGLSMDGFQAAISSPPYADSIKNDSVIDPSKFKKQSYGSHSQALSQTYGRTDGQLGAMKDTSFDAAVSSPPYDEARIGQESGQGQCGHGDQYGQTAGQLGGADNFWMAARSIVEQVFLALQPGGHAVWVVKDYVKSKRIVPFCDQWRQLCEAVGFVTLHEHHAMLVHHKGTQHTLDGGMVEHKTESKSFFRRLAEKNGSPRIDYETVFCMVKPGGQSS